MNAIASFVFSPFAENTYVIADADGTCAIIDPGCSDAMERAELEAYIQDNHLTPVHLLNTHCHIDHVFGNAFVARRWNLELASHAGEQVVLDAVAPFAQAFGVAYDPSPAISRFLEPGQVIRFGSTELELLFVPGHSPASLAFYNRRDGYVIAGDTLFAGSIGRTDLPGGNAPLLLASIERELLGLPDKTRVLAGHMQETTIGREKQSNPFLLAWKKGLPIG
jgi:glyoxylase-like metal-dependent hydrolase (beta-lactamase superfamily II)